MALYRMAFDELEKALQDNKREDVGLTLIFDNQSLHQLLGPEIALETSTATPSQQALYFIQSFVNETLNGGLGQYLHNCAAELNLLVDALDLLEWPELKERLLLTIDQLGNDFLDVRERLWARQAAARNDTEALQAFSDYLQDVEDGPFNEWFFDSMPTFDEKQAAMIWRLRTQLVTG